MFPRSSQLAISFTIRRRSWGSSFAGLLQGMTFEEMRARYLINERAEKHGDDPDFSKRIREAPEPS